MKRFLMALALSCALSTTALAGNIPTSGITPPPPEDPQTMSSDSVSSTDYAAPGSEDSLLAILLTIISVI